MWLLYLDITCVELCLPRLHTVECIDGHAVDIFSQWNSLYTCNSITVSYRVKLTEIWDLVTLVIHGAPLTILCQVSLGHPVPRRDPLWACRIFFFFFCSFFFFFLPPHFRWPFVVKKTRDWAEILHNHTYGHASGRGKKYFRCAHFSLSYLSKITHKSAQ